jgi:hypothetical protein
VGFRRDDVPSGSRLAGSGRASRQKQGGGTDQSEDRETANWRSLRH